MKNQTEFLDKLKKLVCLAQENGKQITVEEVNAYFIEDELTNEQMELVYDYLYERKIVVKGILQVEFSSEEVEYLKEYERDLEAFRPEEEGEREILYKQVLDGNEQAKERLVQIYLKEVVQIAKDMYLGTVSLEDMIQEGNIGLLTGIQNLSYEKDAYKSIMDEIKHAILMLLDEEGELQDRDHQMVQKVGELDEAITKLTEELGRKVTIEELALHMGVTEEEIEDILRLTGEEAENDEEE